MIQSGTDRIFSYTHDEDTSSYMTQYRHSTPGDLHLLPVESSGGQVDGPLVTAFPGWWWWHTN